MSATKDQRRKNRNLSYADDGDDEMYEASEEEGEGESEEAARRREARQRLRKEAKVIVSAFDGSAV